MTLILDKFKSTSINDNVIFEIVITSKYKVPIVIFDKHSGARMYDQNLYTIQGPDYLACTPVHYRLDGFVVLQENASLVITHHLNTICNLQALDRGLYEVEFHPVICTHSNATKLREECVVLSGKDTFWWD